MLSKIAFPIVRRRRDQRTLGRQCVGIDLAEHAIRVVCVTALDEGEWAWNSRAEIPFPAELRESGEGERHLQSTEKLTERIAHFLPRTADARRRSSALVLPATTSVIRAPGDVADAELEASLREDLAPWIEGREALRTCQWNSGDGKRRGLYAVSGSLCTAVAHVVEQAGYQIPRIEAHPHALARAASLTAAKNPLAILHWGFSDCLLVVLAPGNRVKNCPHQPGLCRQLHGFALRRFLLPAGKPTSMDGHAERRRDRIEQCVAAAAEEILRTAKSLGPVADEAAAREVLVCGEATEIPGLLEQLQHGLRLKVSAWQWHGGPRPPSHDAAPEDSRFAMALGVACGGGG